ncbi:acyloxyacyl hydrolase [Chitinophagaceae bacterium LB-8]|uniref:Acyloxyacyl hydrolase n=1 Tax=Paraflavisolibacter caeni TaxID=2982496 RepID=A0A9X2XU40_9BACT|nr:acyloxyacyl hydrolase [Paraflavisolibacter caeni]MCU7549071.1 acyloxyacyl hydrolase [Paraflavisolibacter caeni]
MQFNKLLTVGIIVIIHSITASAQYDSIDHLQSKDKQKSLFSIGAGVQHGFIFAHSQAVQNTKGAHPTGVELFLSWQRNDAATWNLCHCYPRNGLLLSYYDYDTKILGAGSSAAYFLEPTYRLSHNIFFSLKGVAGLSYLSNPFDSIHNPTNQSYSTQFSGYLLVGMGLWFNLNKHWWINTSINYQHESNGGIKQPNKGINWPTGGIALSYQKNSRPFYTGIKMKDKFWKQYAPRFDIGVFGLPRRSLDENGNRARLLLLGLTFQAGKQVGRINNLTLGAEVYQDQELKVKLLRDSLNASPVKAGLLVGHEFILGKFLFSQRLGIYVFDQTPYYDQLYHRWGLQYRINQHIGVGFNLQAHRQVADYVDLRVVYSFQKKHP